MTESKPLRMSQISTLSVQRFSVQRAQLVMKCPMMDVDDG